MKMRRDLIFFCFFLGGGFEFGFLHRLGLGSSPSFLLFEFLLHGDGEVVERLCFFVGLVSLESYTSRNKPVPSSKIATTMRAKRRPRNQMLWNNRDQIEMSSSQRWAFFCR